MQTFCLHITLHTNTSMRRHVKWQLSSRLLTVKITAFYLSLWKDLTSETQFLKSQNWRLQTQAIALSSTGYNDLGLVMETERTVTSLCLKCEDLVLHQKVVRSNSRNYLDSLCPLPKTFAHSWAEVLSTNPFLQQKIILEWHLLSLMPIPTLPDTPQTNDIPPR